MAAGGYRIANGATDGNGRESVMNYPTAIVISAALICGTVLLTTAGESQQTKLLPSPTIISSGGAGQAWVALSTDVLLHCRRNTKVSPNKIECVNWDGNYAVPQ